MRLEGDDALYGGAHLAVGQGPQAGFVEDHAWCDSVNANAVRSQTCRQVHGQSDQRVLADPVDTAGHERSSGGDVHDPPPASRNHGRGCRLAAHERSQTRQADVAIVGAGIAGLTLAARLRRHNLRVVILESGGREQSEETHPLNRTIQLGDAYSGATRGRFRCLGGTSTRWGGALIPFSEHDLSARPYLGLAGFPVEPNAINRYLGEVENLFGLDTGSYDQEFVSMVGAEQDIPVGDADFLTRFAKWPAFGKRNVAAVFSKLIAQDKNLEVWINATATAFAVDDANRRIRSVVATCKSGETITVSASAVVLCAGAIETTRLLLLMDNQYNNRIFQNCGALGCFFNDHISLPVAEINAHQVDGLNRLAGLRFCGSTMRSLRFELSPVLQERERVGNGFAHISFKTEKPTGFDVLRQVLRSRQRGERNRSASLLLDVLGNIPYFAKLGYWRLAHQQLLWPVPAMYELHFVAEQLPRQENCITLSSSEKDHFGLPFAAIRWRVTDQDFYTFEVFKQYFDKFWKRHQLDVIGRLDWVDTFSEQRLASVESADVFHPGGSARMGVDGRAAVVDSNLLSFEIGNLWIASTSVFPSGGGENPTLMLMLFTLRLGDHLGRKLKSA